MCIRDRALALNWGDWIYLFGGSIKKQRNYTGKISRFNAKKREWDEYLPVKLPNPIYDAVLLPSPIPNEVFIFGGSYRKTVWSFNLKNNTFEQLLSDTKICRGGIGYWYDGKYYILGGNYDKVVDVGELDPVSNVIKWEKKEDTWGQVYANDLMNAINVTLPVTAGFDENPTTVRQNNYKDYDPLKFKEYIHIFGGESRPSIVRIHMETNKAVILPTPMNFTLIDQQGGVGLPDGRIVIAGGRSYLRERVSKKCAVFDPKDGSFTVLPKMESSRFGFAIAYLAPYVYAIGGKSLKGTEEIFMKECERYDTMQKKWLQMPPLSKAVAHAAAVVTETTFFVFGGRHSAQKVSNEVHQFNVEEKTWSVLSLHLPQPLESFGHYWDLDANTLFIFGGKDNTESSKIYKIENPGDLAMVEECGELKAGGPALKVKRLDYDQVLVFGGRGKASCVEIVDVENMKTVEEEKTQSLHAIINNIVEDTIFVGSLVLQSNFHHNV
eukprot:TRINITY_DN13724_c0_g1_i2.p1 TRINITY_DN13724_c0_g1~~TRINITY_DN13724_c0_g1_i2.p1  ORF type:complete len:495 (-),score=120.07 TRINITY_DN13724_c0_g1_i2:378-1862(-)